MVLDPRSTEARTVVTKTSRTGPERVALRVVLGGLVLALAAASPVLACSVCFGDPEESTGIAAGIALLLGLVLVIQLVLVRFFVRVWRSQRAGRVANGGAES